MRVVFDDQESNEVSLKFYLDDFAFSLSVSLFRDASIGPGERDYLAVQ
jgi:hypothetical protein